MKHLLLGSLLVCCSAVVSPPASAQQVSRIVSPFGAGGPVDGLIRPIAAELAKTEGPFVVENKAGGSGIIAADYVKRSSPDGRTIFMGSNSTMVSNTALFNKLPYDPRKDFLPIGLMAYQVSVIVSRADTPYATLPQLVEYAKANPGKINRASIGPGTVSNLGAVRLESVANFSTTPVQYSAEAAVVQAMLGGHVDMYAGPISAATIELVRTGKLRAHGVLASKRMATLPDTPTAKELGYDVEALSWFALFAPAGTPPAVVANLNQKLNQILRSEDLISRGRSNGMEMKPGTPADMSRLLEDDLQRWVPIIEGLGIPKQ